jgi:hypothetical protein
MQDIHKSKIIEKLVSGWKVRRKSWVEGVFIHRTETIDLLMQWYQNDDWEGEPPKEKLKHLYCDQYLEVAISLIRLYPHRFIRSLVVGDVYLDVGWHNDELWHLDTEDNMKPVHPAVFHGDGAFSKNTWSVCAFE